MLVVGVRDGGVRLVEVIDGARGPSGLRDLGLLAWLGLADGLGDVGGTKVNYFFLHTKIKDVDILP